MKYSWDEKPDLNITPLVDIMLVLMAILMVTAPTMTYEEKITLPKGSKSHAYKKIKSLEIRMDKNRNIYFKKKKFKMLSFADSFMRETSNIDKNIPVFIRADERLSYKDVMYLLKTIKESGFMKVSLITDG
ncbi:biopolymer transporter ExbD [Hydrogenimonas thermophila]|uniref:biopolymer transporter ExbD n=1 Tax=Hydrogenimonas thermophila TaxID=223786 RepID=UPI0029370EAC|nr:biopolymer transporter ExbD [Hydrogenimonas thermophila]WOE70878.1 biopolymer transporter ExbD [Hydrogenimonas thermophila]WOE73396.1 biopolymer transporter ExbD [Hydrogenimonas thermophila]